VLESQGSKRDDRDDSVAVIVSILESDRTRTRNRLHTNEGGISILPSTRQNGDSLGVRNEKVWPHE
jgi:hypothetical protein